MSSPSLVPTEEQKQAYLDGVPFPEVWRDIVVPGMIISSTSILAVNDVQLDENDVLILSYPKTGTTWTSELVSAIVHQGDIEELKKSRLDERVVMMELDDSKVPEDSAVHASKRSAPSPSAKRRVWHMHQYPEYMPEAAKQGKCKVIVVARNPKDTCVSYYHFHKMAKFMGMQTDLTWTNYFPLFCAGFLVCGDYFKFTLQGFKFCQEHPETSRFVKFEELKADLLNEIVKLEKFIGVPLTEEQRLRIAEHCSFGTMKKNNAANRNGTDMFKENAFMRKGIIGDWKQHFTVAQNEAFMEMYNKKMAGSGLDFVFE